MAKQELQPIVKKTFRFLLTWTYIFIALFLLVGLGQFFFGSVTGDQLNKLSESINHIGFYTQFIRWFLYVVLFIYWNTIIQTLANWKKWDKEVIDRALSSKRSSLIILMCVELFIIQTIHVKLFQFFAE